MKIKIVLAAIVVAICCLWLVVYGENDPVPFDEKVFYKVIYVVDGDTFKILVNGKEVTVRMLGINTPETVDPRKPAECFGKEASKETKSLLRGRSVRLLLNKNREATDKYGRYLAYVYREDGLNVNEYLLENGYAREYTYGRPYSLQRNYKRIEKITQDKNVGLWKVCRE